MFHSHTAYGLVSTLKRALLIDQCVSSWRWMTYWRSNGMVSYYVSSCWCVWHAREDWPKSSISSGSWAARQRKEDKHYIFIMKARKWANSLSNCVDTIRRSVCVLLFSPQLFNHVIAFTPPTTNFTHVVRDLLPGNSETYHTRQLLLNAFVSSSNVESTTTKRAHLSKTLAENIIKNIRQH